MVDIIQAFFNQTRKQPTATAVEHTRVPTTYHDLADLSKQVAAALHSTVGYKPKVFLSLTPSPSSYAGMIGTLMVGGTFCPIDNNSPTMRNEEILHSFKPDVILCDSEFPKVITVNGEKIPTIDIRELPVNSLDFTESNYKDNEAAYVVFTSGSMGRPKGVRIARKGFSHFVQISQKYFRIRPGERWGQYSNLGYDMGIMDVFMALCHGACLVTFSTPTDRLMPAQAIRKYGINIWQSVPSVIELMSGADTLDTNLRSLRLMSFCGEPLLSNHLDDLFRSHSDLVVFNTYGTTETTGFNTLNRLTVDNCKASCIGTTVGLGEDVPGWTITLVDGPSSREGQIVVCGENLSLGYWEDEARTAAAFRELQVGGKLVRGYYTGDWGERVGPKLFFRGRTDRQVKIKGERIELDEIDFRLREVGFPVVGSVLVDDEIYSYIETLDPLDEKNIRTHLAKYLPFHAIPKRILSIEKLPRNQNGKIAFDELRKQIAKMKQNE